MPAESAIVALIPTAESLVAAFRHRYDPSAALGVPAHITILYPFKPPHEITTKTIATLRNLFSTISCFAVSFAETRRFPGVLYLAPYPDNLFRKLTERVVARFPETPPYGGVFTEVIPHLTIAQLDNDPQLNEIETAFAEAAKGNLPIHAQINTLVLMDNSAGQWQVRQLFALQQGKEIG